MFEIQSRQFFWFFILIPTQLSPLGSLGVCCVLCIWWRHLFQCRSSFMPPLPSMVLSAKEGNIGGCYHQWWPAKSSVSWAEWAWWLCICSNSFPWPRITQTKNDGLSFCYVLAGVFFLFFFLFFIYTTSVPEYKHSSYVPGSLHLLCTWTNNWYIRDAMNIDI